MDGAHIRAIFSSDVLFLHLRLLPSVQRLKESQLDPQSEIKHKNHAKIVIAREISGAEYGTEKKKRDKFFLEVYLVGTTLSQATHHHIPK